MKNVELAKRLDQLEEEVALFRKRLVALGVPLQRWLSPQDAADILGTTRDRVIENIRKAEYCRARRQKHNLEYATHYRKQGNIWQVDPDAYKKAILDVPPEMIVEVDLNGEVA